MVPHRQRLEITFDLFSGCAHNCAGCYVNKEAKGVFDGLSEINSLLEELVDNGYVPFDIGIGATDAMSSKNLEEVFKNEQVRKAVSMFHQFTVNAAFLEKDISKYRKMVQLIDHLAPGKPIRFLIPAAPGSFKNDRFGEGIAERLLAVKGMFEAAYLNEAGFVVNCTTETMCENHVTLLDKCFDIEFPVLKDDILNISYGRSGRIDILVSEQIKSVSRKITDYYSGLNGIDERRSNPDLCYHTGTMLNLLYVEGELYWVPFLKDDCPILDDHFKVPRPWTMENLLSHRDKSANKSIEYLYDTKCMECRYLSSCLEKGISSIMHRMKIKDCIVGI